jgi:hypothetical protein
MIPYFWVRLPFFAIGAEKVAKIVPLLSGRWIRPPLSLLEEYKYLRMRSGFGLRSSWATWWLSKLLLLKQEQDREQEQESKGDLEQERLLLPDKLPALDKEVWLLCMALLLVFLE